MTDYLAQAWHQLGGVPVGNADEMRRFAKQLRDRSHRLRTLSQAARSAGDQSGLIEGNLARKLKTEAHAIPNDIDSRIAHRLDELANYLDREATSLANRQRTLNGSAHKIADALFQKDQDKAKSSSKRGGGGGL